MYTYSPAFNTLSPQILYKIIKIRGYPIVKRINYSDSGCVDVYCTQGGEEDALSLRLRASTSTLIVQ